MLFRLFSLCLAFEDLTVLNPVDLFVFVFLGVYWTYFWVCWIWRSILKNQIWGVLAFFSNSFVLFSTSPLGLPLHICCYSWWYPSCLGDSVHFFQIFFLFLHHIGYFQVCWFFFLLPHQIYHWAFSEFSTTFIELQNFYLVLFL